MKKTLLGIGTGMGFPIETEKQIPLIRKAGFDAVFTDWYYDAPVAQWAKVIEREGLLYQSIHAPFGKVNLLWTEGADGDAVEKELCDCLTACASVHVPIMVSHAFIGFTEHTPNATGVARFRRIAGHAEKVGVRIALENTEGEEYLAALMDGLADCPSVGFCIDTGHEICYNRSKDMLALYGDRVIATHMNDNAGITDVQNITWLDDAHLLPFDGIADWKNIVARLEKYGYDGIFTFELTRLNKPERHTHDAYAAWSFEEFLENACERACRVAALKTKENGL